jgi:hypothetical protein
MDGYCSEPSINEAFAQIKNFDNFEKKSPPYSLQLPV